MKDLEALKEHIRNNVSLQTILVNEDLIYGNADEEQLSCPFHGVDRKKSARYYASSDSFYCWVCKKVWDVFEYISQRKGLSFTETIKYLIKTYSIDIKNVPEAIETIKSKKITNSSLPGTSQKNRYLLQLTDTIKQLKNKIDHLKYARLVYSYSLMKFLIPDEKFVNSTEKMNTTLIRIMRK